MGIATSKQVAVVQIAEPGQPDGIERQAFFFGVGSMFTGIVSRETVARAISVWPVVDANGNLDRGATRIAICGDTFDPGLPLQVTPDNGNWSSTFPGTGFIAVLDGLGNLHWSRHFFSEESLSTTTITDVSIRVEEDAAGMLTDFVTFCGMTSAGNPITCTTQPPTTISPVAPFVAPPPVGGDIYTGGDTDNGVQFDGMVGRVSAPHLAAPPLPLPAPPAPPPVNVDFLSLVGGAGADVLLGISQRSLSEFVVTGTTRSGSGFFPPCSAPAGNTYPLTTTAAFGGTVDFSSLATWELGVLSQFRFDAGVLTLVGSRVLATPRNARLRATCFGMEMPSTSSARPTTVTSPTTSVPRGSSPP